MKKMFFVQGPIIRASSLTKKAKQLKVWLYKYDRSIVECDDSIEPFFKIIKEKVKQLNKEYPRSKPLKVYKYSFPHHSHWYYAVRYADEDKDQFTMHIDQIENVYFNLSI